MVQRILISLVLLLVSCKKITDKEIFAKENLIPWAIVGFDVKERSSAERIEMLQNLGYRQYGYGHRVKHIPSMENEFRLAKQNKILISNVWMYLNLSKDKKGALREQNEAVLQNLEKVGLKTQIWIGIDPEYFLDLEDKKALKDATEIISYVAKRAKKINCKIALYNHGGWYGEPKNQIKIIDALPEYEIGVVYNFHHGHDQLDSYSENMKLLLPYLWCVNLNGMKAHGPKIITIGEGNLEKGMIEKLLALGYQGPWGILGHVKGGDPEIILQKNFEGLQNFFKD